MPDRVGRMNDEKLIRWIETTPVERWIDSILNDTVGELEDSEWVA